MSKLLLRSPELVGVSRDGWSTERAQERGIVQPGSLSWMQLWCAAAMAALVATGALWLAQPLGTTVDVWVMQCSALGRQQITQLVRRVAQVQCSRH